MSFAVDDDGKKAASRKQPIDETRQMVLMEKNKAALMMKD